MDSGGGSAFLGFMILIVLLGCYLLPGIIASMRKHPQQVAIWVLNLLGGWTMIGWVVAIVWAFTNSQRAEPVNVNVSTHTAAHAPAPQIDVAAEIERFAKLHASGALTDEEFAAKKRQILGLKDWEPVKTDRGAA